MLVSNVLFIIEKNVDVASAENFCSCAKARLLAYISSRVRPFASDPSLKVSASRLCQCQK